MRVLFWKGPCSLTGRVIRLKTGCAYTHSEFLFSDGTRFGVQSGIPAHFYKPVRDGEPQWDEATWDCIEIGGGNEEAVRSWCHSIVGAEYDWRGILFCQLFPWGWESRDKWFCSEANTAGLQAGSYPQVAGLKPYQIAPHKLSAALLAKGGRFVEN